MNYQDLSGTPCPLPPPLPLAFSIFQSIIHPSPPTHHRRHASHTQALSYTHTRVEADTHRFKRRVCQTFMPVVDYIHKKAIPSFIKNTRQQLLKYSHSAEMRGGQRFRVTEILKEFLRQSTKGFLSSHLLFAQQHQIKQIKCQSQVPVLTF